MAKAPQTAMERAGQVLFRWRSFTPLPLLALAVPLLWRSRGGGGTWWALAGLALCAAGQSLRAWVLGKVPDGTSGQNERLIATQLNTAGAYAHTRNPLYLGNFLITLGLCVVAHDLVLLAAVAALFALQYRAIVASEESFLRARFGARFDQYCARVPRFWPRWRAAGTAAPGHWSWRRALRKEHNPFAAWAALALLLLAFDQVARARAASAPPSLRGYGLVPYAAGFLVLVVSYIAVKGWKHRWFSGGFTDDLRRRLRESVR